MSLSAQGNMAEIAGAPTEQLVALLEASIECAAGKKQHTQETKQFSHMDHRAVTTTRYFGNASEFLLELDKRVITHNKSTNKTFEDFSSTVTYAVAVADLKDATSREGKLTISCESKVSCIEARETFAMVPSMNTHSALYAVEITLCGTSTAKTASALLNQLTVAAVKANGPTDKYKTCPNVAAYRACVRQNGSSEPPFDAWGSCRRSCYPLKPGIILTPEWNALWKSCHFTRGAPKETIAACSKVIERREVPSPIDISDAHRVRGDAYSALGESDMAVEDYGLSLATNPSNENVYAARGSQYRSRSKLREAVKDLNEALYLNPNLDWAREERAYAWGSMRDHARAVVDWTVLVRKHPSNAMYRESLGSSLYLLEEWDKAFEELGEAKKLNSESITAYTLRHFIDLHWGRIALAMEELDQMVNAIPSAEAHWRRRLHMDVIGSKQWELGIRSTALVAFAAATVSAEFVSKNKPDDQDEEYALSTLQNKLGEASRVERKLPEAFKAFEAAIGIRTKLTQASPANTIWLSGLAYSHARLAQVLKEQNKLAEALLSRQEALALRRRVANERPGEIALRRDLLVANSEVGDIHAAQDHLSEALATYATSLVIANELAAQEPGEAKRQRDVALVYGDVGGIETRLGNREQALASFKAGHDILERLKSEASGIVSLNDDLEWFDGKISSLQK